MPSKTIVKAAIKAAEKSNHDFRMSAVLYKGGALLRASQNDSGYMGSRKRLFKHTPTRHAELMAINNVPEDILSKCNILVVRLTANGELTSAKPCSACYKGLNNIVKGIYYTNYKGQIVKLPHNINQNDYTKDYK